MRSSTRPQAEVLAGVLDGLIELDDLHGSADEGLFVLALHRVDVSRDTTSAWLELRDREGRVLHRLDVAGRLGVARLSTDARHVVFVVEESSGARVQLWTPDDGSVRVLWSGASVAGSPEFSPDGRSIALAAAPTLPVAGVRAVHALPVQDEGLPPASTTLQVMALDGSRLVEWPVPAMTCGWHPSGRELFCSVGALVKGVLTARLLRCHIDGSVSELSTGLAWLSHPQVSPDGATLALFGSQSRVATTDYPTRGLFLISTSGQGQARRVGDDLVMAQRSPAADGGPVWLNESSLVARTAKEGRIGFTRFGTDGTARTLSDADEQVTHLARARTDLLVATLVAERSWAIQRTDGDGHRPTLVAPNDTFDRWLGAVESADFAFSTGDGVKVSGRLLRPRNAANGALLLSMHGGPHGFVGPGVSHTHLYRWLAASRGWTVLALNPSGSGTFGDAHLARLRGHWGERDVFETSQAVNELARLGMVREGSVAASGFSYGGLLATAMAARTGALQCAVIGAPVSNLQTWFATSDVGVSFLSFEFEAERPGFWERLRDASVTSLAAQVRVPTLLLQGTADRRCPPAQALELFSALQVAGRSSELVLYDGATHSYPATGRPSVRIDSHARVVEFVERHVRPSS